MGKFPLADLQIKKIWVCRKCKSRNHAGAEKCRRCGYKYLRSKKTDVVKK